MRKLYRCRWDKKIGGVCGGLGQAMRVDPNLLRLVFVFLCAMTAVLPLLVIYLICYLIMPQGPTVYVEPNYKKLYRSLSDRKVGGICGGIAEAFRVDSTIIRIVFLLLMVITGFFPLILTYIVATFLLPER